MQAYLLMSTCPSLIASCTYAACKVNGTFSFLLFIQNDDFLNQSSHLTNAPLPSLSESWHLAQPWKRSCLLAVLLPLACISLITPVNMVYLTRQTKKQNFNISLQLTVVWELTFWHNIRRCSSVKVSFASQKSCVQVVDSKSLLGIRCTEWTVNVYSWHCLRERGSKEAYL